MIRIIRAHGSRAVAEVAREVGWPRLSWRIERRSSAESSQRVQVRNPRAGHPRRDRYRPLAAWRAQPRVEPQCRTQSSWFNESVQTPIMVCHLLRCGFQGLCSRVADLGFRISTSNAHGGRLRPRLGHRCADRSGIDASYHQVANMLGLTELPAGIGRFLTARRCRQLPLIESWALSIACSMWYVGVDPSPSIHMSGEGKPARHPQARRPADGVLSGFLHERITNTILSVRPPLTRTIVLIRNTQRRQATAWPSHQPMSKRGSAKISRMVVS